MSNDYRLHYAPDNASLIIRLALEELGVGYDLVLVDRAQNAQRSAAYLALNPCGKIPVLETRNGPISETGAILLYLAETHGQLAPAPGAAERLGFLKWLFFLANTLHADLAMHFYLPRYGPEAALPEMRHRLTNRLHDHLVLLDHIAGDDSAPYLGAAMPGMLDIYLAVMLRWCGLYPAEARDWFELSRYPNLQALAQGLEQRPAMLTLQTAEGLGTTPLSQPSYANPPEGVAL